MKHSRPGKILTQMAVIIGLGMAIGMADAFVFRRINLDKRQAPKDIAEVLGAGRIAPPADGNTGAGAGAAGQPEAPTATGAQTPAVDDTTAPDGAAAGAAGPTATPPLPAGAGDGKPFTPTPKSALPAGQVTLDEAKAAFDAGAMFVDSRKVEDFKAGHVENAIRIESSMFKAGDPPELGLIPRSAVVIVYCNGGQCDESENVAKFLSNSGYATVYVLHDGFPGWKALGFPIAIGE